MHKLQQVTEKFLRGRGHDRLTTEEIGLLETTVDRIRDLPARQIVVRAGQRVSESSMLLNGFMCRYMDDRAGYRQLVAIQVPGDFVDLHALPLERLDHDVATVGPVRIATWTHEALEQLIAPRPHLTRMLWFSTLLDAAIHREWIFRLGRLDADGRVAHFMCEMKTRLDMVGLVEGDRFALPFKQADLAEACGLTVVHVNRVLRSLRERELLVFRSGIATIVNWPKLVALAEFDPSYLYIQPSTELPAVSVGSR
ncbi:Crp/Fnr family transcriptional regulator [Sphingomonas sp. Leaf339]|uniref:Crp/Fnr family transcriptional regulator n=1 Tax=Sphingomonas sp. Leaf339 TaxID=1736343 RepID=UPI0006F484AA|nr:Crp/Fnr family transcriptional regulator [Sphingomonas sp. Leaf339]KQU55685.1 Crp/Fnr family transcriptional regulator [Sphingomonas sp. Leaf339]